MTVDVRHYASLDELVLNISSLYLVFGFGTGDTFNAMIHLHTAPPAREYELIVKKPQLNLVQFLLGMFPHPPVCIHAVEYWQHDFSAQLAMRFPTLPCVRGVEGRATRSGFLDFWQNPHHYQQLLPLAADDIDHMVGYFQRCPPARALPEDAVVLFPTAGTNFSDYVPDWPACVAELRSLGFPHIYANQSGVAEYGNEQIPGAEPLQLNHEELIRTVYAPGARMRVLAVRSGVLDILRFARLRALVLYQPVPKGIFETCRFGLLPHNLDLIETICLNQSREHQDQMLTYYLRHFLGSRLTA